MKRFIWLSILLVFGMVTGAATAQHPGSGYVDFSSPTVTATTLLVTAPATVAATGYQPAIHVISYTIQITQTATPVTFGLSSGTGSLCGTAVTPITPLFLGVLSTTQVMNPYLGGGGTLDVAPGKSLCLNLSGTPTGAVVHVVYQVY